MTTKLYSDKYLMNLIKRGYTDKQILRLLNFNSTGSRSRYRKRLKELRETPFVEEAREEKPIKMDVNYGKNRARQYAETVKVDVEGFMKELSI